MRFDAGSGGHQGMEREVAGLDPHGGLAKPKRLKDKDPARGTREAGVNAVYAGNFMQDFSQLNTPTFHKLLAKIPKDPHGAAKSGGKNVATIGAKGAEHVADAIIRALAILEVGPRLADEVVAKNMQQYRPEQHVDQPMGYSAADDALVRTKDTVPPVKPGEAASKPGELRPGRRTVEGGAKPGSTFNPGAVNTVDRDRDRELAGSAVPGIQVENPALFKVNDTGLQNHIYNSVEWVKNHWMRAAQLGPNDAGRFHVGAGLHAVEDYFSHSNFVEVGLNSYIGHALKNRGKQGAGVQKFLTGVEADRAARLKAGGSKKGPLGTQKWVDTLFDAPVKAGKRQAVTTGSVGSMDMRSSIGHILLPKVPLLEASINLAIDKAFHLVKDEGVSSWDKLKALAKEDRPLAAIMALGEGLDGAGVTLPVPDDVDIIYGRYIPIPFADDIDVPTDAKIVWKDTPITQAIGRYSGFVKSVNAAIKRVEEVLDVAAWVAFPLVKAIQWVIDKLREMINKALDDLKKEIKHQLARFIVRMLDEISGTDTKDQKDRTIGDALEAAHEAVETFEHQTSLEARLLPGGDLAKLSQEELEPVIGPVERLPGGGYRAKLALPPSHSEISKDHAPYEGLHSHDHDHPVQGAVKAGAEAVSGTRPLDPAAKKESESHAHEHEEGSIFYGIARALAVEADRHVMRQVELMWAESPGWNFDNPSVYGDRGSMDTSKMEVGHDAFTKEAGGRAAAEEKRASKDKFKHAQSDVANKSFLERRPEARKLLDLVDLIISHPDDSQWWRPIVDKYVNAHPDEVARHIRERNAVRGGRTTVGR